jgi:hypothetical protein
MGYAKTLLILSIFFTQSCSNEAEEKDLYVDKLVYFKRDSTLFTGTLKVNGKASYYYETFFEGIPCGEWAEYESGGAIVNKGKYLNPNILSDSTKKIMATDVFLINHWQESELASIKYPPFVTVLILKEDVFFQLDKKQYENYFLLLANAVQNDIRNLKYDYLKISFVNAVHDWNKNYSKEFIHTIRDVQK